MLAATAYNGYLSLTRPPVVISNVPAQVSPQQPPTDSSSSAPPAAQTDAELASVSAPPPKDSGQRADKHKRGATHSGKIDKLKNPGDGEVDVNTADSEELQRLPGVGPAMAQRILTARQSFGGFRTPQDLLEVRGIGPKKYAKMAPFVKT
jgi:competence protein ComEA